MKKIAIPAIAVGVMLVAIGFAIQPVQQATAVHTTILSNTAQVRSLAIAATDIGSGAGTTTVMTLTCNAPFTVLATTTTTTADPTADNTLTVSADADGATVAFTAVAVRAATTAPLADRVTNAGLIADAANAVAPVTVSLPAGATFINTYTDPADEAADAVASSVNFESTNQATCTYS